mmetsp:Transcript_26206/g.48870  ORF Transcript_26206/g.48870 Transcript_26206/m.48870 type:complete len:250 (-) Transcript_26206:119-868(-)
MSISSLDKCILWISWGLPPDVRRRSIVLTDETDPRRSGWKLVAYINIEFPHHFREYLLSWRLERDGRLPRKRHLASSPTACRYTKCFSMNSAISRRSWMRAGASWNPCELYRMPRTFDTAATICTRVRACSLEILEVQIVDDFQRLPRAVDQWVHGRSGSSSLRASARPRRSGRTATYGTSVAIAAVRKIGSGVGDRLLIIFPPAPPAPVPPGHLGLSPKHPNQEFSELKTNNKRKLRGFGIAQNRIPP